MDESSGAGFKVKGTVTSGLARGAQFLGIEWVRNEINKKLGLDPFPGTLNLRIPEDVWRKIYARRLSFVRIAAPESGNNCPGFLRRVILYSGGLVSPPTYIVLPEMTIYTDILEVIAAENLRQKLNLKDGDVVEIEESAWL